VFAPKDFADAREISDELGFTTVPVRTVSKPIGGTFDRRGSRSRSQTLSQQRRALLLPQEVKELGTEEAIVFYEGLRPIRCRKIRYFTDPRFRKRLLPPPPAPLPPGRTGPVSTPAAREPPSAGSCNEALGTPDTATAAAQPRKEDVVIREGTVEDIERIESLTLKDFATDFSKVRIPDKEGPLSDEEMKVAVDTFLSSIERA
jgi:type IV secretion system protein VirD4